MKKSELKQLIREVISESTSQFKAVNTHKGPFGKAFGIGPVSIVDLESKIGESFDPTVTDYKKTEISWHLFDRASNTFIEIWNYKDGPDYKKIPDDDEHEDERYETILAIQKWSVGTNHPSIARQYFKDLGIGIIE